MSAPDGTILPSSGEVVPRSVKGLSLVSLFNDFASEMVYPLLPAFITRTLGGGAIALGALDGAADLAAGLMRMVSGSLSDRPGYRKPLILFGYATAVLARPLMALTNAAWQVVGFRVFDRIGKGLRSPARDAMIAGLTPRVQQGRAFGFHRAADHFGAVAGSITAWILLQQAVPVRTVIGWSVWPGLLVLVVLVMVLRTVPEKTPARPRESKSVDAHGVAFWGPAIALIVLAAVRIPEALLLLRLQDLGVGIAVIPLVWAGLHVVRTAAAYPGGMVTDRFGVRIAVGAGSLVFAGVLALLGRPLGAPAAVGVFLALGLTAGLTESAERAAVARLAPVRTGRGFGVVQGLSATVALPAGIGFGLVYQTLGGAFALTTSAAVLALAGLLWWALAERPE